VNIRCFIDKIRTNVYEESSLGIYANTEDHEQGKETSFVAAHLRKQLSFDLWYIFLGLFIITIAEGPRIQDTKDYVSTIGSIAGVGSDRIPIGIYDVRNPL
jgi:Trk-type K+ transport system membrane component